MSQIRTKQQFIVSATIIGNALEWFDFTLFKLMAPLLFTIFFPLQVAGSSLIYPIFMALVSTVARPLGGIVFGYMGDRAGRQSTLVKTIIWMTIPILLVAVLPSYEQIGIAAAIILGSILFFQGFTLGGEFPGSLVFLIEESSTASRRGYMGSWAYFGIYLGMLLGGLDIYLISLKMPLEDLKAWGWRIPFFMGGVLGIVSVFLRRLLRETPFFRDAKEYGFLVKEPIFRAVHKYKKMLMLGIGLFVLDTAGFNLIILFSSSYFVNVLGFSYSEAFAVNVFTIAVLLVATPFMGYVSIKQGVKKVALWSAWALVILAIPSYFIMHQKIVWMAFVCQGMLAFCLAAYLSCLPALICMLFPVEVRYSGTSLSVNLGLALFGGAGPFIMTYLINRLDTPLLPSFYLIIGALISLLCLSKLPKKSG